MDAGTIRVVIEADAPRVRCAEHGVTVAAVPWARHDARHTRAFDDQVAWLATHTSKTAVVELMRIAWRTVGAIAALVVTYARAERNPFDGLVRIRIDEISFRRGHKYLMVVVDHDTGRLVLAAQGHDRKTLQKFFDLLGPKRCAKIRLVSADAAEWIGACATDACEHATLCLDPFHIARHNNSLYRAYLLKEQFRLVFHHRGDAAVAMLDAWLGWARRSRIQRAHRDKRQHQTATADPHGLRIQIHRRPCWRRAESHAAS